MTPIAWFFCLAPLWTVAVDTQMDAVQPLVMAVYVQEHARKEVTKLGSKAKSLTRRIILTDAKKENFDSLKSLFSNMQPTYIALLCADTEGDSTNHTFIVKQVIDKIDSMDLKITCEHFLQPYVKVRSHYPWGITNYDIGFDQEEPDTESSTLLRKFMNEFEIKLQTDPGTVEYLEIRYNYYLHVPESITHMVTAHMHSYTHEEECEEIYIPNKIIGEENRTYDVQFEPKQAPHDHQWRQLVPMQDFRGIYPTQATCIYLNYVLLHKNAIDSLKEIEIFIQKVADVTNEVYVVSQIDIKKGNDSVTNIDQNGDTIPTLVLKKISYTLKGTTYGVIIVIHNKESKKFCENVNGWSWPEHNDNGEEMRIGTIYYCSMESSPFQPIEPFNLDEIKPDGVTSILEIIQTKGSSRHIEEEASQQI